MDKTPTTLPGHAASRRRLLLRGAMAAPALMTVCSGAAAATASNLRCLTNANGTAAQPAPGGTTATDGFMRVRLWKVDVQSCNAENPPVCTTEPKYFVKGEDLQLLTTSGTGVPTSVQAIEINNVTYQTVGDPGPLPTAAPQTTPAYVDQWVAVRFDSSGAVVGFGDAGPGAMVGASCFASLSMYLP